MQRITKTPTSTRREEGLAKGDYVRLKEKVYLAMEITLLTYSDWGGGCIPYFAILLCGTRPDPVCETDHSIYLVLTCWGTRWRSWLSHCASSRKVAGSIPHDVTGIFHWHNPSDRTMALGSTQPLTEMSKAVPLQAWSGPEGSRKLSFPDFMTTAQEVGKVVSLTHRQHSPPGNARGTHFC